MVFQQRILRDDTPNFRFVFTNTLLTLNMWWHCNPTCITLSLTHGFHHVHTGRFTTWNKNAAVIKHLHHYTQKARNLVQCYGNVRAQFQCNFSNLWLWLSLGHLISPICSHAAGPVWTRHTALTQVPLSSGIGPVVKIPQTCQRVSQSFPPRHTLNMLECGPFHVYGMVGLPFILLKIFTFIAIHQNIISKVKSTKHNTIIKNYTMDHFCFYNLSKFPSVCLLRHLVANARNYIPFLLKWIKNSFALSLNS